MSSAEVASASAGPSSSSASDKGDQGADLQPIRSPSPEAVKCTICLGDLQNKSYSNSCRHLFCFGCLLEWSKVKPECPLCKSPFRSIIHNIRSTSDYDEYVVPANIPHLSIRLATAEDYPTANQYGDHFMQYERERRRRLDDIHEAVVADLERQRYDRYTMASSYLDRADPRSRVIRYLEVSERPTNFAFLDARLSNPFQAYNEPEYFGTAIDLVNEETYSGTSVPGYQSRRRVYDRGQYVLPFHSTLQPGTVFFPSIEYFRTHPSAPTRVSPWLHRELLVLLGLSYSRQQLAVVYDLILSLLQRYDIRSKEFRDMTKAYFGAKIRHFQHEFYHFVLSGMRMTDYDNVASYSQSASSSNSASSAPPPVVTLDSDHADTDDDEVVVENVVLADPSSRAPAPRRRGALESRRFEEAYGPITLDLPVIPSMIPETDHTAGISPVNSHPSASTSAATRGSRPNDNDWMPWPPNHLRRRHAQRHGHSDHVHSLNSSQPSMSNNSYFQNPSAPDFSIVPGDEVSIIPQSTGPLSPRYSSTSSSLGPTTIPGIGNSPTSPHYSPTSPNYTPTSPSYWLSSPNYSPVPTSPQYNYYENDLSSSSRVTRSRDKSDRRKRSKVVEGDNGTSKRHCNTKSGINPVGTSSDKNDQSSSYRIRLRSSTKTSHQEEASTNSARTVQSPDNSSITELTTGENYTYNSRPLSGSGIGVHIRIVGRNNSSSGRSEEPSTSAAIKVDTSKCKSQKPPPLEVVNDDESDEDCVLLGVHPVVKKPPLAVITISSDDEEEESKRRMKAERERSSVEAIERDSFLELFDENILLSSFDAIGGSGTDGTENRMSEYSTVSHSFMDSLTAAETIRSNSYALPPASFQKDPYSLNSLIPQEMSYSHVFSDMSSSRHPSVITIADTGLTNSYCQSNAFHSTQPNQNYQSFVSGMKRHSYHARPEEPSTSMADLSASSIGGTPLNPTVSNIKSSEKQKSGSSSIRSPSTTRKSKQEEVKDSSHSSHKKKSKHKKAKKVQSHKKKAKKSKRDRRASPACSVRSSFSDISVGSVRSILQLSDSETTAGDSGDATWDESELKVPVKYQHKKNHKDKSVKSSHKANTRVSCRGKKSSSKDKKKSKYEKKSRKKARVLDDSSTEEDDYPLKDWFASKRKKIKSRAIISSDSSSDPEREILNYSKESTSFKSTFPSVNNDTKTNKKIADQQPSTSKRAKERAPASTIDFSEIPNFGVDLRTQPQTTVGMLLDSCEQGGGVGGSSNQFLYNVRPQKHRWESEDEDNMNGGDNDKIMFTKSTVGLHHLTTKSTFDGQNHSDSSNSSVDDHRELVGLPRIEPHDFLHAPLTDVVEAPDFSQSYRSPPVAMHDAANEIILNCDGMSSEDEAGLLNLPYQSVEQMAAAILARTLAATGNNISNNNNINSNMGHRSDSTDDLMLDITDDDQGLTGLDLSLGRYDVGNDGGTPHTVATASSSSYSQSQRWWSQPNQDWDD